MREITVSEFERSQAAVVGAEESFHMDEETFRGFYERTARPLCVYLSRASGDAALAEDLMQETYYRFLRVNLPDLGESHRKNYLFRIATNLLRDHWRSNRTAAVQLPETVEIPVHDPTAERIQQQSILSGALQELKPREREILWLAYGQGSSHKEIAEVLGLKAGSIRLILFRARKKLAHLLRRQGIAGNPSAALSEMKVRS